MGTSTRQRDDGTRKDSEATSRERRAARVCGSEYYRCVANARISFLCRMFPPPVPSCSSRAPEYSQFNHALDDSTPHSHPSTTEATNLKKAEHLHSDPNPTVPHKPASSLVERSIMIQLTTTNTHVAKGIQFMDGNNDLNMRHRGGRRGQYGERSPGPRGPRA